jgi:hypothetical protein
MDWAAPTFGSTEIMLSEGGRPSSAYRSEVDLYVQVDGVDALFSRLKDRVEVVEPLSNTYAAIWLA